MPPYPALTILLGPCIAILVGCTAPQRVGPEALERLARGAGAKTVVAAEDLTVFSPYGPRATANLIDMIREEYRAVCHLFEIETDRPLLVWLEAVESDVDEDGMWILEALHPRKAGMAGLANTGGNVIVLYVSAHRIGAAAAPEAVRHTARHELAHIASRRKGLVPDRWLGEGLAEFVANLQRTSDGRLVSFPPPLPAIWNARLRLSEHSLESVLEWSPRVKDLEVLGDYYLLSHAFVQFLFRRRRDEPLLESIGRTAAMARPELVALEAEWKTWLESLDYLSVLQEAAGSEDLEVRKAAASMLASLAEFKCPVVRSPRATDLALRMLSDPVTARSATAYLVYYRVKDLDERVVDLLIDSREPFTKLVGHALRVRRGGRPEPARYEDAYQALSTQEKARLILIQRYLFPGGLPDEDAVKESR